MNWFQRQLRHVRTNRYVELTVHYGMRTAEITCMFVFGLAAAYASVGPRWNTLSSLPFPLADPQGVIADSRGRVFVGSGFWGSVQVYDCAGKYLHRFRVDVGGGGFGMRLGNGEVLEILPVRRKGRVFRYSKAGVFLGSGQMRKSERIPRCRQFCGFTDPLGRKYILRNSPWWPEIVRVEKDGQISLTIRNPWYYAPIAGPIHIVVFATLLQICRWLFWGKLRKPAPYAEEKLP